MIPSLIFSFAYLLIIRSKFEICPTYIYNIFNGVGHLWFLPMLFWCFILTVLVEKLNLRFRYKILIVAILTLCSIIKLPLRVNQSFNYILFFYGGFRLNNLCTRHLVKLKRMVNVKNIVFAWAIFLALVSEGILLKPYLGDGSLIAKVVKFSYASIGVLAIFMTTYYKTEIKEYEVSESLIEFGNCCFGIYLLQEFIIRIIYYKSEAPFYVSLQILPWLTVIITLIISYLITKYCRKYKLGRLLLG